MPDDLTKANGTPNWVDCAAIDLAASETFYAAVFGWSSERQVANDGSVYALQRLKGKRVAGLYELTAELLDMGVRPHWDTYFEVADVDGTLDKVRAAGGTVADGPGEDPEVGSFAVVQDTVGAYARLWHSAPQQGAELLYEPGAVAWNELSTNAPQKAATFYKSVFGVETASVMVGPMPYTEISIDGQRVAGILRLPQNMADATSSWDVYFATDNVDATLKKATDADGEVVAGPIDLPDGGQMAVLKDPQGAVFKVIRMGTGSS